MIANDYEFLIGISYAALTLQWQEITDASSYLLSYSPRLFS